MFCFYAKIMAMIEEYWYEFSKIYARLMRLEIYMKRNVIYSTFLYYGDNVLSKFKNFFENKKRRKRYTTPNTNNCKFDRILNNNKKSDRDKFAELINRLYFSDLLCLVLKMTQFKIPQIVDKFYFQKPEKIKILEDAMQDLINLRNCVAHYDFDLYKRNKRQYLDSLMLFEVYMGHNISGVLSLPKITDLTTKNILYAIYKLRTDLIMETETGNPEDPIYINRHRMLLTLFDDIALYNGLSIKNLPSPWGVLRAMYKVKAEIKKQELTQKAAEQKIMNNPAFPLFFEVKE